MAKVRNACSYYEPLPKESFLALINEEARNMFQSMSDNEWSIISFDAQNRTVCVQIYQFSQTKTLSVTLSGIVPK